MSEMLMEVPPEYRPPVANGELPDYGTPEFAAELRGEYGPTEKAVADIAIEGSGLVDASAQPSGYGEQLSIENEPGVQWRAADVQNRQAPRTNIT